MFVRAEQYFQYSTHSIFYRFVKSDRLNYGKPRLSGLSSCTHAASNYNSFC